MPALQRPNRRRGIIELDKHLLEDPLAQAQCYQTDHDTLLKRFSINITTQHQNQDKHQ